jgi:hypothetical protein
MSGTILEGITQGSFQHSLVEIGSVVSEEKIILKNPMGNSHKNLLVWNQLLNWNQTLIK